MPTKKQLEKEITVLEDKIYEGASILTELQLVHEKSITRATETISSLTKNLAQVNDNLHMVSKRKDEVVASHHDADNRIQQLTVALQEQTTMNRNRG